jgi:acyl carrier protein
VSLNPDISIAEQAKDVEAIRAKIKKAIKRVAGIEVAAISDTASYEADLGLDSLSVLEIAVEIENQFNFHASDEELGAVRTVEDAVKLVAKKLGEVAA